MWQGVEPSEVAGDAAPARGMSRICRSELQSRREPDVAMNLKLLGLILMLVVLLGGATFLSVWQPTAHPTASEIPVPNDRLSIQ